MKTGGLFTAAVPARVGVRTLLFSEPRQELYELDELARTVWEELDRLAPERRSPEAVAAICAADAEHRAAVAEAVRHWTELGLLTEARTEARSRASVAVRPADPLDPVDPPIVPRRYAIGGLAVAIRFSSAALERRCAVVLSAFRGLRHERPVAAIDVLARNGSVLIAPDDAAGRRFPLHELVPALKAELAGLLLRRAPYAVALHAAALERDGRVTLLCGPPGEGKTTLSLALSRAGRGRLLADDLVLLLEGGLVRPVPFPAAIKPHFPSALLAGGAALEALPEHRRPDGVRVRYASVDRPPGDLPVERIVVLERGGAGPAFERADPIVVLGALLAGGHRPGGRLDAEGFRALAAMLDGAACFVLRETAADRAAARLLEEVGDAGDR